MNRNVYVRFVLETYTGRITLANCSVHNWNILHSAQRSQACNRQNCFADLERIHQRLVIIHTFVRGKATERTNLHLCFASQSRDIDKVF